MKSPLTKLAAAAAVLIACVIGLSLWKTTGSGIALADVLARVEQVKSVRSEWTYKMTGGDRDNPCNDETHWTWLESREYGTKYRTEALDPNSASRGSRQVGDECYRLIQKKTEIVIFSKERIYMCTELEDVDVEEIQEGNIAADPSMLLKEILQTEYESLGRSTIDGVEVAGFRSTAPKFFFSFGKNQQVDVKLWVDVKTLLPVRYDVLTSAEINDRGDRLTHHAVMHDFQWDVPVTAADFEPPVPAGYIVRVIKWPPSNEETAIQGLKQCIELLGRYPQKMVDPESEVVESKPPAYLRLCEETKGLGVGEATIKRADFMMPLWGLERFVRRLERDKKDPAYYGKTVTPKDADKVLLRWKVSDKEYRIIFGDLHAETASQERLAELEKALPK